MAKRNVLLIGVAAAASVLAYVLLDAIVATAVTILVGSVVAVLILAGDWDKHPTFEQRELARARKRAARRERTKDARARDRARWEAHQAKKAARPQS